MEMGVCRLIAVVFAYTTLTNIIERPDGIKIASFFIFAIIASSFISRVMRSTEVRIDKIELDETAQSFIDELNAEGDIRIVTNRRETGDIAEYRFKEHEKRIDNHIPSTDPVLFYEIELGDASEFKRKTFYSRRRCGRVQNSADRIAGCSERYRRTFAAFARFDREDPARLFWLERG